MTGFGMGKAARQTAFTLAVCLVSGSCTFADDASKPNASDVIATAATANETDVTSEIELEPRFVQSGGGIEYDWGKDHIFVKLTSAETGGGLTLIQDNLKSGFNLDMHLHREHTEIFYILEGDVEFETPTSSFTATTGSVVYLGAGAPHAAHSTTGGRMLMFYAPGGFDRMLEEIENASWFQKINPFESARRNKRNDFIKVKRNTVIPAGAPDPVFVSPSSSQAQSGSDSIMKLNLEESNGVAQLAEETLAPGAKRRGTAPNGWDDILYVLDGEIEFAISGETQTAGTGATLYLPAGTKATITSTSGAKLLSYIMPAYVMPIVN